MVRSSWKSLLNAFLILVLLFTVAGCIKIGKPAAGCQMFPACSPPKASDNKTPPAGPAPVPPGPPAAPPGNQSGAGGQPATQPSGQDSTVITQSGGVAVANWIGTWQCGNYKMYLDQSGDRVTGWHEYENSDIEGKTNGNTLTGTWTGSTFKYYFELSQSSDSKSFSGRYRVGSSGDWAGTLSCIRTSMARPPAKPTTLGPPPVPPSGGQPGIGVVQQSLVQPSGGQSGMGVLQPTGQPMRWTGTWECNNYKMFLNQTGGQVAGYTDMDSDNITGFATGNTLVGNWTLSGIKYEVQLSQASDGKSFSGHYRQDPSGNWSGIGSCTLVSSAMPPARAVTLGPPPTAPVSWTGAWQCGQQQIWLLQTGSQIIGWYDEQNGDIAGNVTGNTLVGTWTDASGAKDIQLSMAADGSSFSGHYRASPSSNWISHFSCTRKNAEIPLPKAKFEIKPTSIVKGSYAQLTWSTLLATSVEIKPDIGPQGVNGKITVKPDVTTTYTLTATNPYGGSKVMSTLTVTPSP